MFVQLRRSLPAAALCGLACAPATVEPTPEPEPRVTVEREPEPEPRRLTPSDNTGEALLAAAEAVTCVEVCDIQTGEAIATLAPATVERLRAVLRNAEVNTGVSAEPVWPIVLRVEVEGRREPFVVQIADIMLRVKPADAWSPAVADESGEIDMQIREIVMDFELQSELAEFSSASPDDRRHAMPDDGNPMLD